MHWQEVSWIVEAAHRQPLEDVLEAQGALAISAHNATQDPSFESTPGTDPEWQQVRIVALFDEQSDVDGIQRAVDEALGHRVAQGSVRRFEDRDWVGEWTRHLRPQRFGDRLWVVPLGQEPPPQAACVVRLDPGLAFGSGTHETTRLCLEWLAAQELEGRLVVDYGCGSGILGIAALRLGARRVLACDIDPQAIAATAENARRNGVSADLQVGPPGSMREAGADLVLANILLQALVENSTVLARHVRAGGQLLLSGVLHSQVDLLIPAFEKDFSDFQVQRLHEWVCVVARRRAAPVTAHT